MAVDGMPTLREVGVIVGCLVGVAFGEELKVFYRKATGNTCKIQANASNLECIFESRCYFWQHTLVFNCKTSQVLRRTSRQLCSY